jgi:hypothetical protein
MAALIGEHGVKALMSSQNLDWPGDSLSFRTSLPHMEWLSIASRSPIRWTSIEALQSVKTLVLHCRASEPSSIDLTKLPGLEACTLTLWRTWVVGSEI